MEVVLKADLLSSKENIEQFYRDMKPLKYLPYLEIEGGRGGKKKKVLNNNQFNVSSI